MAYWWGHDTIEDKEKRKRQQSLSQVIEWKEQRSELQKQGKYKGYLPAKNMIPATFSDKLEEWREVQRGTARKHAERLGKAVAAKMARTTGCG